MIGDLATKGCARSNLVAARQKADERLEHAEPPAIIAEERALEDEAVRDERTAADETLQREREETTSALARLLPMEREKTDRYLLTERHRSDDDISHRDDFLGIVSHDLRNLLTGIVVSAAQLSKPAPASDLSLRSVQTAALIHRYAARMNRLIGDLVDVASIEAGTLLVSPARGDTSALIDEAIDMFQALAVAKGGSRSTARSSSDR